MKLRNITLSLLAAACLCMSSMASASTVYDNGPDDGQQAYTINFGFAVTNSFVLASGTTVNSATFSNWLFPGETASSVDWLITTAAFGGTTIASGTASISQVFQGSNGFDYDVYSDTISLGGVALAGGTTYWLELENLNVSFGDAGYWGESGGASQAFDADGAIPSESFSLDGGNAPPPIPEPSSILLFGTGLLGAAGAARRKFCA